MNAFVQQCEVFEAFRNRTGHHSDLAKALEMAGFVVDLDSDHNGHSFVKLQGCWHSDGSDIVIGEIWGDSDAVIK
jgi:hypothetical protein